MYTFGEAAKLAGVSTGTVRNWLLGYVSKDKEGPPLFKAPAVQGPVVSFLQLIEVVVVGKFRKSERLPLRRIAKAYEYTKEEFQLEYPFAHLRLETLGGHIIHRMQEEKPGFSHQALDEPAQWSLPGLVLDVIQKLVYEQDLAARWYPVGKDVPIVVDPRISAGIPTIETRGVTVQALHKRWKAGHKIAFIATDLALRAELVEHVLQYAEQIAA